MTYSSSSGRDCQARTSSWIEAVTSLISPSETSTPYSSRRWRWISRVVIPPAYRARICSSKPSNERSCLGTTRGSKLASRSRGRSTVTGPSTVRNVFDDRQLLRPLVVPKKLIDQLVRDLHLAHQCVSFRAARRNRSSRGYAAIVTTPPD